MSDQNDVFSEQITQEPTSSNNEEAAPKNEALDAIVAKLAAITREDGTPKYDDIDKALDALKASQDHISVLESDNKSLKAKADEAKKLEEIVQRLGGNMNNEEKPEAKTNVSNGGLSEEAAIELVKKVLQGERQTSVAVNNVKRVNDTLIEKHGDEGARKLVAERAKALNMSLERFKQLSAESPDAALALIGGGTSTPSPSTSSFNLNGKPKEELVVKRPEKSLLSGPGATDKARREYLAQIKANVYKRFNVET
jgi:hypothetical protein